MPANFGPFEIHYYVPQPVKKVPDFLGRSPSRKWVVTAKVWPFSEGTDRGREGKGSGDLYTQLWLIRRT